MFCVGGTGVGPSPLLFPTDLSVRLRGMTIKSWSEPPGDEQQTQHPIKFMAPATVWEPALEVFLLEEVSGGSSER